jgi:transposase-like protein
MSHRSYTDKVRQQAITRALDPHTTIAQVAREVGCSIDTMHRWLREHRQSKTAATVSRDQATFIPVNIVDPQSHPVEIVTPNGITIRLADASPQYIAELLNAFATC